MMLIVGYAHSFFNAEGTMCYTTEEMTIQNALFSTRGQVAPLWHLLAPPKGGDDKREQATTRTQGTKGLHHIMPVSID
jgi:hypothetical protein